MGDWLGEGGSTPWAAPDGEPEVGKLVIIKWAWGNPTSDEHKTYPYALCENPRGINVFYMGTEAECERELLLLVAGKGGKK